MSAHRLSPTLSFLLGARVLGAEGDRVGRLQDIAVATGPEAGRVAGIVVKSRAGLAWVSATELAAQPDGSLQLKAGAQLVPLRGDESFVLLRQDLLDQQIIDVHGRKVVRVNDVDLQWFHESADGLGGTEERDKRGGQGKAEAAAGGAAAEGGDGLSDGADDRRGAARVDAGEESGPDPGTDQGTNGHTDRRNDLHTYLRGDLRGDLRTDLRVCEVEVGLRGAVRRLLLGLLPHSAIDRITCHIAPRVIPWDFVDLIEADPARRVKLKLSHERLAQLHPSDIAEILEDLAPAEREAIFATLDEGVAAHALEESDPALQKSLVESLISSADSERMASIVEEMDPEAAADMLAELPAEHSESILEEMDEEQRQEVEELLEFREDSAAGRMTTDYVEVPLGATVSEAVEALRRFDGAHETVTEIYLTEESVGAGAGTVSGAGSGPGGHTLKGVVPLARIVLAQPETRLSTLADRRFACVHADAHQREVAELFDKYNLRALPVVDGQGCLVGVVEADHVIAFLRDAK